MAVRMPIGLPSTRPAMTPTAIGSVTADCRPDQPPITTPAESNAKIGTATPAEIGRHMCSKCSAMPGRSSSFPLILRARTGTANPRSTPATVACTPAAWTNHQVANANGSNAHQALIRRCTSRVNADSGSSASSNQIGCRSSV